MAFPTPLLGLLALAAPAEVNTDWTYAVLGAGIGAPDVPFAGAVRVELSKHRTVLDEDTVRLRLAGPRAGDAPPSMEEVNALLEQAATLDAEAKTDESLRILDGLITRLSSDVSFNAEKLRLLHLARVEAARILIGKAGKKETGRGETDAGRQARTHLMSILAVDPTFVLDAATYSPRVRLTMDYARQDYAKVPKGSLSVTTIPNGAAVFFEGRKLGETPLRLNEIAPLGSYRVWAEYGGVRSIQRVVTLQEGETRVVIPLAQEGALGTRPGALDVDPGDIDATLALNALKLLGVQGLVTIAEYSCGSARCAGIDVVTRDGAFRRTQAPLVAEAAAAVAAWIRNGSSDPLLLAQTPPSSFTLSARDIVILPVEGIDVPDQAAALETAIRASVEQWTGHTPRRFDEVRAAIAAVEQKRGPLCRNTRGCLDDISRLLGAQAVIRTRIHVDATNVMHAVLHVAELETGRERVRLATLGSQDRAVRTLGAEVGWLVAPGKQRGTLVVRAEPAVQLFLDGAKLDPVLVTTGLEGLPAGPHVLRARAGNVATEVPIQLSAGERLPVDVKQAGNAFRFVTPAAAPAPAAPAPVEPTAPSPIMPITIIGLGAAVFLVAVPVLLGGVVSGAVSAVLYGTADKTRSGLILAREGESAEQLSVRTGVITGAAFAAVILAAISVVTASAGLGMAMGGGVLFALRN